LTYKRISLVQPFSSSPDVLVLFFKLMREANIVMIIIEGMGTEFIGMPMADLLI
jgi:hypothetical protein